MLHLWWITISHSYSNSWRKNSRYTGQSSIIKAAYNKISVDIFESTTLTVINRLFLPIVHKPGSMIIRLPYQRIRNSNVKLTISWYAWAVILTLHYVLYVKYQLMNFLSPNDDNQQHKVLWESIPTDGIVKVSVTESKYRKTDDTLIIIMEEELEVIITISTSIS